MGRIAEDRFCSHLFKVVASKNPVHLNDSISPSISTSDTEHNFTTYQDDQKSNFTKRNLSDLYCLGAIAPYRYTARHSGLDNSTIRQFDNSTMPYNATKLNNSITPRNK
ncbi:hypothetical protein [Acidithrix ferrooxidans]|uniref:Uncharacterized protein n=1 Tax=Acidithrix ferrooxidans TaxID=1280514 RepID=A0A0D8HF64_9ACTN|nr:hypothetical protein [Acidithrix ferrooxidans]KJF16605.1 hypothetical protein AXFE_25730 [Acidithrix ferrooxidans]CAG4931085.1 unnamed protein product [Acidithrix sp. C25]